MPSAQMRSPEARERLEASYAATPSLAKPHNSPVTVFGLPESRSAASIIFFKAASFSPAACDGETVPPSLGTVVSSPNRAPGKHFVLHLDQSGRREQFRGGRRFLTGRNKSCHPYLAISKIWIAFAVATFQGGTYSPDLKNAPYHAGVVQSGNQAIALFVNIRCDLVCNLPSIAAQSYATIKTRRSEPNRTSISANLQNQP